jgi:hypothetical protein
LTRDIAKALDFPAVQYLLKNTPAGNRLVRRLAGLPDQTAPVAAPAYDGVMGALKDCRNIPLVMAMLTRLAEFRGQAARSPSLASGGFSAGSWAPSPADARTIATLSGGVFRDGFITKVPVIVSR